MCAENSGPRPLFDKVQVRRALELIDEKGPIGRKKLVDFLDVGEGSVRTILERLKDKGFISSSSRGHEITDEGRESLEGGMEFLQIDAGGLTVGDVDIATLVKDVSNLVDKGIEQRDEAIKVGAEGATVLVYEDGDLALPDGLGDVERDVSSELLDNFELSDGDVVIIGTGGSVLDAERGALAAAESLM